MGLGLVSQRSRSRGSKISVLLETTLSRPQDLKEEKNEKKRHEKSTQLAVDSHQPFRPLPNPDSDPNPNPNPNPNPWGQQNISNFSLLPLLKYILPP